MATITDKNATLRNLWDKVKKAEHYYDSQWEIGNPDKPKTSPKAVAARRTWVALYAQYKNSGGIFRYGLYEA